MARNPVLRCGRRREGTMMTAWRGHARAPSCLINQRHVQVDGSRRIILAIRAVLERPEW
jgi:hypothetical protein